MKKNPNIQWIIKSWQELTREDLYKIGRLRIEVFVVEQNCPYQDFDGNDDKSDHLLGVDGNKQIVAYSRIVFPEVTYPQVSIGRVIVDQQWRKQGLGVELMNRSIAFVKEKYGKVTIHISAQKHLDKFYQSLGFIVVTQAYLEDGIPHVGMELDTSQSLR